MNENLNKTIEENLMLAKKYLLDNLSSDNLWRDFYSNTHKESIDWVTGYIGNALLVSDKNKNSLEKTAKILVSRQNVNGGWGYNKMTFSTDADSTANIILFLSHFNSQYSNELYGAKEYLLEHQKPSGGFSTYTEFEVNKYIRFSNLNSVIGWSIETPDVSAMAINALSKLPDTGVFIKKGMDYLKKEQRKDGGWNCYWWTQDTYSTALCSNLFNSRIADLGKKWLEQNTQKIPFYKALALSALVNEKTDTPKTNSLLHSLIDSQNADGSWNSKPILKIPHPSNTAPWSDKSAWREEIVDQNRLFTTATAYSALKNYVNQKYDKHI